jgi:hypothetical protein
VPPLEHYLLILVRSLELPSLKDASMNVWNRGVIMVGLGLLPFVTAPGSVACADSAQSIEANTFKLLDKEALTVHFAEGKADLAETDRLALRALADKVKGDRDFDHFVVASWSDQEFPEKGKTLPPEQRKLADERVRAVKGALMRPGAGQIQTYSFAEHPSWLGKVFNSENAKVKQEAGAVSTSKDLTAAELGRELHEKGGPRSAVIILVNKSAISH